MELAQVVALDRTADLADFQNAAAEPKSTLVHRLRDVQAMLFVGLGLLATVAWMGLLGWLMYRLMLSLV
jgi:hypothetical protein